MAALHGGGAAVLPGAGMGAVPLGVNVLRVQTLKQRVLHAIETRTPRK
jgi:hypothetical protein